MRHDVCKDFPFNVKLLGAVYYWDISKAAFTPAKQQKVDHMCILYHKAASMAYIVQICVLMRYNVHVHVQRS